MRCFENFFSSYENKPPNSHAGRLLFHEKENVKKEELLSEHNYAYLFTAANQAFLLIYRLPQYEKLDIPI